MKRIAIAAVAAAGLAGAAALWIGSTRGPEPAQMASAPDRAPSYYQDPSGKPIWSATPRKSADGRNFIPIYEPDPDSAPSAEPPAAGAGGGAAQGERKLLYYRNPMGLPDTSRTPKKDSMGMDYIPVYSGGSGDDGLVRISPGRMQLLGVRTAAVEEVHSVNRQVRAAGLVTLDERRQSVVTTKVEGWIEKLRVAATGEAVRRGQTLAELYAPELVTAEKEYLVARDMAATAHGDAGHGRPADLVEAARARLAALDVPPEEIQRLERSGTAVRRIPIKAPADGVVIDKSVIEGMRVMPGEPLFRTADLSSVWLIAEVPEQELGLVQPGQTARATFVAYPGRTFDGVVDFIYPTLSRDSRTAKVRVVVPNRDRSLLADMYAAVTIQSPTSGEAMVQIVPDSAVLDSGKRQLVLVDRGEGRFEPRPVRAGARGDGMTQILEGLKAGEKVVVGANFLIDAESNLRAALQTFGTADPPAGGTQPSGSTP